MMQAELLAEIEKFLEQHDMAPTTFGRLSCGDNHAVARLRKGLGLTVKRAETFRKFMDEYESLSGKPRPKRPRSEPSLAA